MLDVGSSILDTSMVVITSMIMIMIMIMIKIMIKAVTSEWRNALWY